MKVKATNKYQELNVQDKILGRIPKENEIIEIDEERFEILNGKNDFKVVFVTKIEDITKPEKTIEVENAVIKPTKKRTTKKEQ